MKRFAILFFCFLGMSIYTKAQTYTQHLQQQQVGKGKVTISQSKEIDNLVNGVAQDNKTTAPARQTVTAPSRQDVVTGDSAAKEKAREEERKRLAEKAAEERKAQDKRVAEILAEDEPTTPTVDTSKKVMRGSRKVTGFRVQAFAGGNTRADKQKAQNIGDAIKMKYPDQPVYVHFYSPRWICRIGNYRTYSEASTMLKAVKAMGYKSATIVKGKITVFE